MEKTLLFVYNPTSGKANIKNVLFDVINILSIKYEVTVHPTKSSNDAYQHIKSNAANYDIVVVSGGDGTLNEAVSGMLCLKPENRRPIGYIPSGTTNDFATSRNIPKDPIKAAEKIISGSTVYEDIGLLNGKPFHYVAAFGSFTDVPYDTPQGAKNIFGQAAYVVEGLKRINGMDSIKVNLKYEDAEIEDYFTVGCILNTTSMAGINFDGKFDVSFDDGKFEVLLVKMPVTFIQLQEILVTFLSGETNDELFRLVSTSKLSLHLDSKEKWTLDGEFGGAYEDAEIEVLNKAIPFIL